VSGAAPTMASLAGFLSPLTEPFESEFMRTGALAAVIVGVLCGAVGVLVVTRGMALLADSFAHGVLPGVAIAVLLTSAEAEPSQVAVLAGGLLGGLLTAAGTTLILRRSGLREDTAAAVMFVFMLALGVVLISRVSNFAVDLTAFLFGDVLSVDASELPLTAALAAVVLLAFALLYRPIVLVAFDRRRAAAAGLPVERLEFVTMLLLAVAVVVGFRVVGALLVLGLLIAPPAAAAMVTRRLPAMIAVSAAIAALSGPVGLLISWHFDVAAGAASVLTAVAVSVALIALRPRGRLG
jgi:ABC-type Mn2+/Zn2+ transport system permease subunit